MNPPGPANVRAPRLAALLASALCLAGCASGPPGAAVGSHPAAGAAGDGGRALASLPPAAGRVVAVRRTAYANGLRQEIVLDGPRAMTGENRITVEALTTAATGLRGRGAEELTVGRPSDTEIAAEMDRSLPGVPMRLAPAPVWSRGGAVGYAAGATGRLSCVYAWQVLEPARPLSLLEGVAGTGALPVSVRVRLCREGPAAALVEALRGLAVSRPDGSADVATARPPFAGDALTEAVGSLPPAAARDRSGAGSDAATDAAPAGSAHPRRRRPHRLADVRPRAIAHSPSVRPLAGARRRPEPSESLAGVPRVPLPDEVSAAAVPRRPAPSRAAAADTDMPMPR